MPVPGSLEGGLSAASAKAPEIVLVLVSLLVYILPHSSPLRALRGWAILSIDTQRFQEALCALLH
jgi:hypothetical protein